jgi:hypothetical protein
LADAIRRGEGTATGDAWSREDFLEEGQEKMEAGKDAMRAACQACLPLAETISERFLETATDLAKDIEAKELAEYQTFDVPYSASRLVLEIRRVGAMARSWVQQRKGSNFSNNSPQSLMPYLEL